MEIRRMRADETEAVVRVWRRSRDASQPWLEARMGHTHDDDMRYFGDAVVRENEVWIAVEGEILGFVAVGNGVVSQLYVDPAAQGRGVGGALLAKAKALSPAGLELFTHQRNEKARAFYERRGFRAVRFGVSPPPENEPDVLYVFGPPREIAGKGP